MVILRFFDGPLRLRGFIRADEDGNENMYINRGLSEDQQRKTYDHEMRHKEYGHLFDDTLTTEEKEYEVEYGKGTKDEVR